MTKQKGKTIETNEDLVRTIKNLGEWKELVTDELASWQDSVEARLDRQSVIPASEYAEHVKGDPGRMYGLETKASEMFGQNEREADFDAKNVRAGALMLAQIDPSRVYDKLTPDEQKAFSVGGGGASGGYLVPTIISGRFLDAVRNRTRVLAAGARTYPMKNGQPVSFPYWETPIQAGWRAEGQAFPDGGGTFATRSLTVRSVAVSSTLSLELLEDGIANDLNSVSAMLEAQQAKAIAEEIDRVCLVGDNANGEPVGLYNDGNVAQTALNATPSDYGFIADAITQVRGRNFVPDAAIFSERTRGQIDGFADTLGQPLRPRHSIVAMREEGQAENHRAPGLQSTNQVPDNLTDSGGTQDSLCFVGDWDELLIGMVNHVRTQVDPYTAMGTAGNVILRSYMRVGVLPLRPEAFQTVTEILP